MKKKILYLLTIVGTMLILTGCWDRVELNDRHVVLELAIDKAENVQNKVGQGNYYEVTYTIPDMKKLSGTESLSEDIKTSMVTISPTLIKSIDEIEAKMQNTLTFSHVKAILLGEELLKDRQLFENIINSLSRNIEFSRGINILAVQGKASEITTTNNYQNPITGLYVMKYFSNTAKKIGNVKQQSIGNMLREVQNTGITTLPIIANTDENAVKIGGAAVIKDYQLVDWLSEEEVRGMNLIDGDIEEMPIVIEYKGEYLTYTIREKKTTIDFKEGENIEVDINLLVRGEITEGLSAMNNQILERDDVTEIKTLLIDKINKQLKGVIQKEKDMGVDFLKIELALYRKYPKLWNKYRTQENISNINKLNISLNTNVILENTGVIE